MAYVDKRTNLTTVDQALLQIADLKTKLEEILSKDIPVGEKALMLDYIFTRLNQLTDAAKREGASQAAADGEHLERDPFFNRDPHYA